MSIIKPNNNTLSAITALPTGLGGKVLQVVQDTLTSAFETTSTSYVDTGLTASITPSSTSNKILILLDMGTCTVSNNANDGNGMQILRDSTQIFEDTWFLYRLGDGGRQGNVGSFHHLDTPSSTSSLTYKVQTRCRTDQAGINMNGAGSNTTAAITLLEIAGWL